mgnify:FL=1
MPRAPAAADTAEPAGADQSPSPPRNGAPRGWTDHVYETALALPVERADLWAWLNDTRTFTDNQVWPYRVEFLERTGIDGGSGFAPGVLNMHHGPLLMFAGELGEIDPGPDSRGRFRDLCYTYGSFAVSPRLIRPTRLRFWLADAAEPATTDLTVRVDSLVTPRVAKLWTRAQGVFWRRFFRWTVRGALKRRVSRSHRGI